jgi:predicted PurR-regulated permease PerM
MDPANGNRRTHVRRSSLPARVIAIIAVGVVLYFARAAIAPVALAILFSLLLMAPVEALHRHRMPRGVAALLVLGLLISLIGVAVNLLWTPAQNWWAAAPQTLKIVEERSRPIAVLLSRMEQLTASASEIGRAPPAGKAAELAARRVSRLAPEGATGDARDPAVPQRNIAVELLDDTRAAAISIITLGLMMIFLLSGGPPMLARICAALAGEALASHSLRVIDAVRSELSRYYTSVALINLGLGLATAGITALLGMPNPLLWGSIATLLNFIPYVGSALTLLLLTVVAFVTFSELGHVFAVTASYLALATLEGQVAQPLVVGRRLELNPIIVFLALWFGGWFWGIAGIVIAVPTLVSLKVVAQHSAEGHALTELLGPQEPIRRRSAVAAATRRIGAAVGRSL